VRVVTTTATPPESWHAFFAHPAYAAFAGQILDAERTAAELAGLQRLATLGPGVRVLDLGCGYGRFSLPLARLGCAVTGLDGSHHQLELARAAAADAGLRIEFVEQDMRELRARERYDVVVSLGTALGYSDAPDGDLRTLRAAAAALVPGGVLLVDTENREPKLAAAPYAEFPMGPTVVRAQRRYDHLSGRWTESMTWGDDEHAAYGLWLYSAAELSRMARSVGLVADRLLGSLDGRDYTLDAPRTVIRARKEPR
jgi:SAM-dependent methyltransferase